MKNIKFTYVLGILICFVALTTAKFVPAQETPAPDDTMVEEWSDEEPMNEEWVEGDEMMEDDWDMDSEMMNAEGMMDEENYDAEDRKSVV